MRGLNCVQINAIFVLEASFTFARQDRAENKLCYSQLVLCNINTKSKPDFGIMTM